MITNLKFTSNSTARCVFSSITLETRVLDIFYLNTGKSSAISVFELIIRTVNDLLEHGIGDI